MTKFKSSFQMNKIYSNTSEKSSISFLNEIKNKLIEIKTDINNNKKYSLMSVVFLSFIENKTYIMSKKEIYDFVKNEIVNNPNRIVSTFKFKKEEKEIVTENNYYLKLYNILFKNKIFNKKVPPLNKDKDKIQYELNLDFIDKRKNFLYREMFGEEFKKKSIRKRKQIKFNNSLSMIKSKKSKRSNKSKNDLDLLDIQIKTNNNLEIDSSMISIKDSEIKMKKSEEPSIINSSFIDSIKFDPKKLDFIDMNVFTPKSNLYSKKNDNSNISSNENSLIIPLFTDSIFNEKNLKYNGSNGGICSNSLKEINNIINKSEEFLSILKNPQLLNLLNSTDTYKKLASVILNLQNDNYPQNLLKTASDNYTDFCKYINFVLYSPKNKCDLIDGNDDTRLIKIKCSLIISGIITKLSQFLLEYNYFVEIISDIFEYEQNFILKEMIKIINYYQNVLSKANIDSLESLLKLELDIAISSHDQQII